MYIGKKRKNERDRKKWQMAEDNFFSSRVRR